MSEIKTVETNDSIEEGLEHLNNAIKSFTIVSANSYLGLLGKIIETLVVIAETIISLRKNKII